MNKNRRSFVKGAMLTGSAIMTKSLLAELPKPVSQKCNGYALGTDWQLTISAEHSLSVANKTVKNVLDMVDQSMSPFIPDSEVSLFNRPEAALYSQPLTDWCSTVAEAALGVAQQSNGAFDPTVGPLVNQFGFGPITGSEHCKYHDLSLSNGTITKLRDGVTIDLCGIAKGFAIDKIVEYFDELGHQNYLLELGGELFAKGEHPSGRSWNIAIESPTEAMFKATLKNRAIATSGIAQNSFEYLGATYSHLISPTISNEKIKELFSVSVFHPSAMMADAWSTALYAMGKHQAIDFATEHKLDTVVISKSNHGSDFVTTGEVS